MVFGALTYLVIRSDNQDGEFVEVASGLEACEYTNTDLENGVARYYRIVAVNEVGAGQESKTVGVTPLARPRPPSGVSAISHSRSVTLNWQDSPGCEGYVVCRSERASGPFDVVEEVTGNHYTDEGLQNSATYYYVVKGVNPVGQGPESKASMKAPRFFPC